MLLSKSKRVLLLQLLALFVLAVSAIGSVYGALEVVLSAPTSASIDRTVKVDAVLRAGSAG